MNAAKRDPYETMMTNPVVFLLVVAALTALIVGVILAAT